MSTKQYVQFSGIDRRRSELVSDERTARYADNLILTSGKVYRSRPGTRKIAQLPEETKGLYAANGVLRSVCPAGQADLFAKQTARIIFDFVEGLGRDDLGEFINYELYGTQISVGVTPFVVIRNARTGLIETHLCADRPDDASDADISTRVRVPYQLSTGAIKLATKLWIGSSVAGNVAFSSTEFGPTDWTAENDAGFLPVQQHVPGDAELTALGHFRGRLVVFFADSIQEWGVDADPINHTLAGVYNGPGTLDARSVVNVLGDLYFYSRGGFRSLTTQTITGELREGDIGSVLGDLDDDIAGTVTAGLWSQTLGCYLVAAGSTVFCYTNDPLNKTRGWTTWTLPWSVTDLCEIGGKLYARTTDHAVYEFDEALETDEGFGQVGWQLDTQRHHIGAPGRFKQFQSLQVYQSGVSLISFAPDDEFIPIYQTQGNTPAHARIPIPAMAESVALRFTGGGRWQFDGYALDFNMPGGR